MERRPVSYSLTWTPVIVLPYVSLYSTIEVLSVLLGKHIYVVPFYRPPKSIYPDVVQTPPASIHAGPYSQSPLGLGPIPAGELAPLVGVYDLRTAVSPDGRLQDLDAARRVQRIVQAPSDYVPAIHVDDCRQVHEALTHRNVGKVEDSFPGLYICSLPISFIISGSCLLVPFAS